MALTNFGVEARKIMLEKDMTMTELAKQLGISNSYLTDIFRGGRKGTKQKQRIAEILGMEVLIPKK